MAENTKIEWATHTFNPWIGCTKVSPACDHCYAEKERASTAIGVKWGTNMPRHRTGDGNWKTPGRWNASAERRGVRESVFCASLGDWADNAVPAQWRFDLADVILKTTSLDWLLLTKRIGNAAAMLAEMFPEGVPSNVWVGATICNQEEADRDIPKLLAVPAARRFLSMEPLLGPVDLDGHEYTIALGLGEGIDWLTGRTSQHSSIFGGSAAPWLDRPDLEFPEDYREPRIHWVIVGGESGPNARPMHQDWARSLLDQCQAAGVPFLFKQWGEWIPASQSAAAREANGFAPIREFKHLDGHRMHRVGKKAAGRLLDGVEHNGLPA